MKTVKSALSRSTRYLAAIALSLSFTQAGASVISFGATAISNPDNFESFDRTGNSAEVATDQFSDNGLTFVQLSGLGPTSHINSACNVGGLTGSAWVAIGVQPSCGVGSGQNTSEMVFDQDVSELSFLFRTNNQANYLFESFLDGNLVASLDVSRTLVGSTSTILFDGVFDTIRFTEQVQNSWFWIDDLAWNNATSVPAPAGILLFGLGLVGAGLGRRRLNRV